MEEQILPYPFTLIMDRYNGTYSGGKFLAMNQFFDNPKGAGRKPEFLPNVKVVKIQRNVAKQTKDEIYKFIDEINKPFKTKKDER